jgi:predicted nucleic acid-binding protein
MILADTSIWIDLWRSGDAEMQRQLVIGQIVLHPFIVAELALGSLHDRQKTLADLEGMAQVNVVRREQCYGRAIAA